MKKLESVDQNFIKTLLDNIPQNIEEFYVPKDKNNKKTLELISLAEQKEVAISFNKERRLSATFIPSQVKDINFLEKLINRNKNSLILILDHIMDPQNVGSILRTALAADVEILWLASGVDPLSQKVLRSSAGAVLHLPYERIGDPSSSSSVSLVRDSNLKRSIASEALDTSSLRNFYLLLLLLKCIKLLTQ